MGSGNVVELDHDELFDLYEMDHEGGGRAGVTEIRVRCANGRRIAISADEHGYLVVDAAG